MCNYKEYEKECIGSSDCGFLVLVGNHKEKGVDCQILNFGEDNDYNAYMVSSDNVQIGNHYTIVAEFEDCMKIYDDDGLVKRITAEHIKVYRAGEMGCIIQFF